MDQVRPQVLVRLVRPVYLGIQWDLEHLLHLEHQELLLDLLHLEDLESLEHLVFLGIQ